MTPNHCPRPVHVFRPNCSPLWPGSRSHRRADWHCGGRNHPPLCEVRETIPRHRSFAYDLPRGSPRRVRAVGCTGFPAPACRSRVDRWQGTAPLVRSRQRQVALAHGQRLGLRATPGAGADRHRRQVQFAGADAHGTAGAPASSREADIGTFGQICTALENVAGRQKATAPFHMRFPYADPAKALREPCGIIRLS